MAEFNVDMQDLRRYEVSIWTLQDRFLSILKWFNLDQKGQIQNPEITLKDDGTQEFNFSIPKLYYDGSNKIPNPMWYQLLETPIEANMHKLKVVFNKNIEQQQIEDIDSFIIQLKLILFELFNNDFNLKKEQFMNENEEPVIINQALIIIENIVHENITESYNIINQKLDRLKKRLNLVETVLEFLVVSVVDSHKLDEVTIDVSAEGLAFHELGKLGYKITLNETDFELDSEKWFKTNINTENEDFPEDIHYWNKKIFGEDLQHKKTNWYYKVDMDWSSHSYAHERRIDQVYEDEYVSSWQLDRNNKLTTKSVEGMRVRWASIDVKESNIYNITQTIAENFGVFCRYEYVYDENYNIVDRYVIYYNNYIQDKQGHMDLTYPYTSSGITRTVDSTNITTKLYVRAYEGQETGSDIVTIMDVGANKSKEDYLLNFDYLYKIGTITEEQYEAIEPYENALHKLNNELYVIQERIRILTTELQEWEAKLTIAKNALDLDDERYNEAGDFRSALTNNDEIPVSSSGAAIKDLNREGQYYLNLSYKGIRESSVQLYKNYNTKTNKYSDEIFGWRFDYDEYHQITKIIGLNFDDGESKIVYYKLHYNPILYWDKVQEVWKDRKVIDLANYNEAQDQIIKINNYLYGMRVDYGKVDEVGLSEGYYPYGHIDKVVNENTGEATYSYVDNCRVNSSQNPVPEMDINTQRSTPDLYYNEFRLLNEKEVVIDKFNRMMGPALREGYWQPDDIHDYGDMFQDSFIIYPSQNGSIQSDTNTNKNFTSGYVNFLWDSYKYYDNESPFIYESEVRGTHETYIAINLTNYMDLFVNYFDNLAFFYYDLDVLATIYQIEQLIKDKKGTIYSSTENGNIPVNFNTLKNGYGQLTEDSAGSYFWNNSRLLNQFKSYYNGTPTGDLNDVFSNLSIGVLTAEQECINKTIQERNAYKNSLSNENNRLEEIISVQNQLLYYSNRPAVNPTQVKNDLEAIPLRYHQYFTYAIRSIDQPGEQTRYWSEVTIFYSSSFPPMEECQSQISANNHMITIIDSTINILQNIQRELALIQDKNNQLVTNYEWIESIQKNALRSLEVGSQCELGWLKDYGQDKNTEPNAVIPVLILIGAKSLDKYTINFIATGRFNLNGDTGTTINVSNWNTEYLPFIGYYNIVEEENNGTTKTALTQEKLCTINYSNNSVIYENLEATNGLWPAWNECRYRRVYPRIYFNTLRLKNNGSDLEIKLNNRTIENIKDYYITADDRSKGLEVQGIGYYATFKPDILFKLGTTGAKINLLFTLSNIDTSIYLDAVKVAKENAFPKVSYNVELSVLNSEFVKTAYNKLNQIVQINDNDLQLEDVNGYISSITLKLDKPWEDTVEIKNYQTKFEDLFSTIVAQTEAMKKSENGLNTAIRAFGSNGLLTEKILQDSIRAANLELAFNQGKLTISEENGIWAVNDEGGVVAMRGGGIFTATERDADGKYIWNTGILPSGINASLITSGQLNTNLIKIYSGDQLRFQWNGEGLYAYKQNENVNVVNPENTQLNDLVDKTKYVVYNSEGLFLIDEQTQSDKYGLQSVKKVEVSWNGFILRNNDGTDVFSADDKGNLSLIGKITSTAGSIGGWEINESGLFKEGIQLLSKSAQGPGILLAPSTIQSYEIGTNNLYYIYKDSNSGQIYYLTQLSVSNVTKNANEYVYTKGQVVVSVEPKYQINSVTYINGTITTNNITDGIQLSNNPSVQTVIYVGQNSTTPMLYNGENIIYDFNNSPNRNVNIWYDQVRQVTGNNYQNYVTETQKEDYVQVMVKDLPGYNANSTLILIPQIENPPTFSAYASGDVIIQKGTIGNFIIKQDSLSQGRLYQTEIDETNKFYANGQWHSFGKLFYDIQADSNAGILTLTQINGNQVNFNIAAMPAYQNAIAAAAQITLTLVSQDGIITATATNNQGVTVTKQVNVSDVGSGKITAIAESGNGVRVEKSIMIEDGGAPDIGSTPSGCSGCTNECKGRCGATCKEKCSGGCSTKCTGGCRTDCAAGCADSCADDCTQGCNTTCHGTCTGDCTTCSHACSGICYEQCGGACSNDCWGGCTGSCDNSCKSGCTSCDGTCKNTAQSTCYGCGGNCTHNSYI